MVKKNILFFLNSNQPTCLPAFGGLKEGGPSYCLAGGFKSMFFILFLLFTFYVSPVYALDPIIIIEAFHPAPPPQADPKKQIDHFSNDTALNNTTCSKVVKIVNTFQPKTSSGGTGPEVNVPYFVNEIKQLLSFGKQPISNTSTSWLNRHISKNYSGSLNMSDPTTIKKAFNNFDATTGSTSNATVRGLPNTALKCLKGKRLVAAIEYASSTNNSIINNEAVACHRGEGKFDLLPDAKINCPPGSVITLTDIAHFLAKDPSYSPDIGVSMPDGTMDYTVCGQSPTPVLLFYPIDSTCTANPVPLGGISPPSTKISLTGAEACYLFKHLVQPVDIGSNAQKIRICSPDKIAGTETCTTEDRSLPMGNQYAVQNSSLATWTIPSTQTDKPVDICETPNNTSDVHKSNEFSILAFIKDAFGWVKETAQVFSGPVTVTTKIDTRLVDGIARDTTFTNNLLPQEQQDRFSTADSAKASSNDSRSIDVGDPLSRTVLNQNLLPANFF